MFYQRLVLCFGLMLLTACGGQGSYSGPPSGTYVVSVTVSGLPSNGLSQVVIQNNAAEPLSFTKDGTQAFPQYQPMGTGYNVTISNQPSPSNCVVASGSGTNSTSSYVNINVTCSEEFVYVTNNAANTLASLSIGAGGVLTPVGSASATGVGPTSVVIHPNGNFAYVSNAGGNTISVYTIQSGTLGSAIYVVPTDTGPVKLATTPNGNFLYAVNINAGTISEYSIAPQGGRLTEIAGSPYGANNGAHQGGINAVAIDPSSTYLYVSNATNSTVYEYQIRASDGVLHYLGSTITGLNAPTSVAISPNGKFAYVVNSGANTVAIFSIDAGGTLTPISSANTGSGPQNIAFTPNGAYAYVTNYNAGTGATLSQFTVNTGAGNLTPMPLPSIYVRANQTTTGPYDVVVDPTGQTVFSSNRTSNSISQYSISNTGALSISNAEFSTGISSPQGIAVH